MSPYEKTMLFGGIAVSIAYGTFALLMTDGTALGVRSALFMGLCLMGFTLVVAITVVLAIVVSNPKTENILDEREEELDVSAGALGYHSLEISIFVVLVLALMESHFGPNTLGSFSLGRPEGIVFWLVSANAFASLFRLFGAFVLAKRA